MRRTMPTLLMELFRMCKNATSAMPVALKLWLMSKRHEPSYRRPAARPDFNSPACFSGELESSFGCGRMSASQVLSGQDAVRLILFASSRGHADDAVK